MVAVTVESLEETQALAEAFAKTLKAGDVVVFRGGLGAGKTTFIKALAAGLGVAERVFSPTFALVNQYKSPLCGIAHFDMYRIQSFEDLESTGYFDYLDSGNLLLIEWPEHVWEELPAQKIVVSITHGTTEEQRNITIEGGRPFANFSD